jgi:hypothetical protein
MRRSKGSGLPASLRGWWSGKLPIAGWLAVNYHGLSDFRVDHVEVLDRLLSESVAALIGEGLVSLSEIAVDGTLVRASASQNSFKEAAKLAEIEAAGHLLSLGGFGARSFLTSTAAA